MAHDRYLNSIQEAVDGTLGSIRRAELEMHLAECAECRALMEDLERIRDAAAALPPMAAPDRTWLQIAGRLRQEGRIHEVAPAARSRRAAYGWLALAATLVIAVGSWLFTRSTGPTPVATTAKSGASAGGNAPATRSVEAVQSEVDAAQQKFEQAIADLEKVAKANQTALDPATSATIDKNLAILNQAIDENRAAVKSEPTSVAARETLFDALRQKVTLLQDTIALINEMRKGNNAAAAQLVNKS
jgi:anti-sigma factor RsiW